MNTPILVDTVRGSHFHIKLLSYLLVDELTNKKVKAYDMKNV